VPESSVLLKRNKLVESNLDLVVPIARQLAAHLPDTFEVEDLAGVGMVALLEAAQVFEPDRLEYGLPQHLFRGFARQRIRGAILDSVRRSSYIDQTLEQTANEAVDQRNDTFRQVWQLELRGVISRAIDRLPDRQLYVVEQHYRQGRSLDEIGRKLEVGTAHVRKIRCAALRRLRKDLGELRREVAA